MAEREFDDGNGRRHDNAPRPPPAMSEAQRQHLNNVRRLHASRFGAISNNRGLLPSQFGDTAPDNYSAAAPSAPSGAAHGYPRADVAADFINAYHRRQNAAFSNRRHSSVRADADDRTPPPIQHHAPLLHPRAGNAVAHRAAPHAVDPRAAPRAAALPSRQDVRANVHPNDEVDPPNDEFDEGDALAAFITADHVTDISPDAEDDGGDNEPPAAGALVDGETSAAERYFVKEGNDLPVLFAMGIGLTNEDNSPFSDWEHRAFDNGKRNAVKPEKKHLSGEQHHGDE